MYMYIHVAPAHVYMYLLWTFAPAYKLRHQSQCVMYAQEEKNLGTRLTATYICICTCSITLFAYRLFIVITHPHCISLCYTVAPRTSNC